MAYKTPGVYTEEISLLPPSVAEVETALPAIVGYTARADRRGQDLTNVPVRIGSMLEYVELFGGPPPTALAAVVVNDDDAVLRVQFDDGGHYHTFTAVRHFFDNGGGDCYVVSVGRFGGAVDAGELTAGVRAVAKVDEPTILLVPDACVLGEDTDAPGTVDNSAFYALQQTMLAQCVALADRVALFDLKENTQDGDADDRFYAAVDEFRDNIGINGLKYGAAYGPWLVTTYPADVDFALFRDVVEDEGGNGVALDELSADPAVNALVRRANASIDDAASLAVALDALNGTQTTLGERYVEIRDALSAGLAAAADDDARKDAFETFLGDVRSLALGLATYSADTATGAELKTAIAAYAGPVFRQLVAFEKHTTVKSLSNPAVNNADVHTAYADAGAGRAGFLDVPAVIALTDATIGASPDVGDRIGAALAVYEQIIGGEGGLLAAFASVEEAAQSEVTTAQQALYAEHPVIANLRRAIAREIATIPPSAAVAGVYATVDRTRGVHKAPANVSLAYVSGPTVLIGDAAQERLNVDVVAGKSVNAIRTFAGRGTLVWGARTLAGNDNEWRYVPVRRLFNTIEESVKKSTAWAVFEPNDANLWVKVKGMIDNYLTTKWQEGALAGASPAEAFYTAVGLGQTMSPQDVLEGRLIVEIGLAAVRPAEFIILRFSHKLQQS